MLREEVEEQYKWNLDSLYANQEEFDQDYQKAVALLEELKQKKDHICDDKNSFKAYMDQDETLGCLIESLYVYAKMNTDVDPEQTQQQYNLAKAAMMMQRSSAELNFSTLELIQHKDEVAHYLKDEDMKEYRFPIYELFRTIPHRLDEAQEEMLAQIKELTSVPSDTYQSFRVEFEPVTVNGKKEFLNGATYREFLKHNDQSVRKEAFTNYFQEYKRYENVFANTLTGHIKGQVFMAKARKFASALEASLFQDESNEALFHKVLAFANQKYRGALHEYYAFRKEVLDLKEQHVYDLNLELVDEIEQSYEIEECFDILKRALAPLSKEYTSLLDKAKKEQWIDFMPSKGKRPGAYSWGSSTSNPYILTNFTGSYESLTTLAHELGHSMHSYFSNQANRPMLAGYKIFVAEVASTVNEVLLNTYLLHHTKDTKMKAYILYHLIEQLVGTLYRQPMFAEFEETLHRWIESKEPVSSSTITDYYMQLNKDYFGSSVIVDELQKYGCYYVPHFYYNFYVYKYTVGMAVALSFAKKIEQGDAAGYLAFLHKGGSQPCIDQLKEAGVDPCSDEVYEDAFSFFQTTLHQLKTTLKQMKQDR